MISRETANSRMIEAIVKAVDEICSECRDLAEKTGHDSEAWQFTKISNQLTKAITELDSKTFDSLL